MMLLKVGDQAPDFSLPDATGNVRKLSDYQGKHLLLYFYPKDDTPGCTKEACNFRDSFPKFDPNKITVVGISKDGVGSHKKFAEKYSLPFTILSDVEKKTVQDYDVWQPKKFMGREYLGIMRTSFLIDPQGKILKIYENVNPLTHSEEVLKDIESLD
jgi:peroxiredoxin Q/BCP